MFKTRYNAFDLLDEIPEDFDAYNAPYTCIGWHDYCDCFMVIVDMESVEYDIQEGELPYTENVNNDYLGLSVTVSDHGNAILLWHENGETTVVWAVV